MELYNKYVVHIYALALNVPADSIVDVKSINERSQKTS